MLNRSTVKAALQPKPDCLTLEELDKYAESGAPSHPHLAECSRCQAELALLKSFQASEPLPGEGAAVAWIGTRLERQLNQIKNPGTARAHAGAQQARSWFSRVFSARSASWLVPVTALLVIAVTGFVVSRRSQEPQLRADAGNGPAIYRSQEVQLSGPAGEVPEAPKALEWKGFAGAVQYKVSIMEVDEAVLWSGETRELSIAIPNSIRAKMLPGKSVLWRVTAIDSQGRVVASSQLQRFSVQHKSARSSSGALPR
jgi:hypothetical protein